MTMESTNTMYDTARTMYLGWVEASVDTNERLARVARAWIDESLAAQQDMASIVRRAVTETERTATTNEELAPFTLISRVGDIARVNYEIWTEAGLKAQERVGRLLQTTFDEMRGAQSEIAERAQKNLAGVGARSTGTR